MAGGRKPTRLPAPLALAGSKREIRGEGQGVAAAETGAGRGGWRAKRMHRPTGAPPRASKWGWAERTVWLAVGVEGEKG